MGEQMLFPDTLDEFLEQYSFKDSKEFYTNGSILIPVFRVKQWFDHIQKDISVSDTEKYKLLYENERDHSDTLLRIIFKMFDLLDADKQQVVKPLLERYPEKIDPFFKPPYEFTCKGDEKI